MTSAAAHKELLRLLYTDELTHLYNRRYLKEQLPRYFAQAEQKGVSVAFLMLDMDNFKSINDTYGHQAGDQALIHLAKVLVGTLQRRGIPIRYAGDEFVVIAPGLDKSSAAQLGETIQKNLEQSPLQFDSQRLVLRCSIGVALFPKDGKDWEQLFEKADEALYVAKRTGKGRVFVFPDSGKLLTPAKLDSILAQPYIVGRDDIIHFLENHLSQDGDPSVFPVLMGGEGAGKSRLIAYGAKVAAKKLSFVLNCKGYPFWQTEMYGAVFSALGKLFEQRQDISDLVFEKLDDRYKVILKPRLYPWDAKEVLKSEEVAEPDSFALFEALTQTFFILMETGPGAILLDDAEQIDPPSLQFFDTLFNQKEGKKLLFAAAINSPDIPTGEENLLSLLGNMKSVASSATIKKFELKPLRLEDIRQLTAKIFDGQTFTPEVEQALLHNSGGIPLFVVEAISFLLQEGKIVAAGDRWDLSQVKPDDIPPKLEDLLRQRLMSMDEEAIRVLKLASVLGERINPKQLAALAGLKEQQVLDILGNAKRALLIEETPNPDEYVFSHRLDRAVFYSLLDDDERRHYHELAAEVERKFGEGALERVVGRLAYHYQNAGRLDEAVKLLSVFNEQMNSVLISEGTRRALRKRIITASMAKESPLEESDLARAVEVARAFKVAMQNLRLYPRENENVKKSVQRFLELLNQFLESKTEALSISLTPETMLFNGQAPPPNKADSRLTEDLYSTLSAYGLQGVLFLKGIGEDEVVSFLEVFKSKPEEVSGRWDELVEQYGFSHILPDRKIFVAVGERRIALDEGQLVAQVAGKQTSSGEEAPTTQTIPDEKLELIKKALEEFKREKDELIEAIRSGNVSGQEIERLVELLQQTELPDIAAHASAAGADRSLKPAPPKEERYADVLPDVALVQQAEMNITLALQDLSSEDTTIRAKAAAWLMKQNPAQLAEAIFSYITSDAPLRSRRLAAAVIAKIGGKAAKNLLGKIGPGTTPQVAAKIIDVLDLFTGNEDLLPALRNIMLLGDPGLMRKCSALLSQFPAKLVNPLLLEAFEESSGRAKLEVMALIAERGVTQAAPLLAELIKPRKMWEKEEDIALQVQACKTLGLLRAESAADALIQAAVVPKPWTLLKPKPPQVRAAAAWALKQLPQTNEIKKALDELKKDKSPKVRKAAS